MPALLASVRSLAEARLAVTEGCDWLDLKEPREGALGAPDPAVVRAVVGEFSAQLPVSATIGDCWDTPREIPHRVAAHATGRVPWVKFGLFRRCLDDAFCAALRQAVGCGPRLIAVNFAEDPLDAAGIARLAELGLAGVMLDTADKAAGSLTRHLSLERLREFVCAARAHGLIVGLAGSLRAADIPALAALAPDYLGFRGALCMGSRTDALDLHALRDIRGRLTASSETRVEEGAAHGVA
jgi:uncharacterized protein (UPF0264 family)